MGWARFGGGVKQRGVGAFKKKKSVCRTTMTWKMTAGGAPAASEERASAKKALILDRKHGPAEKLMSVVGIRCLGAPMSTGHLNE